MAETRSAFAVMPHHIKPRLRPGRVRLDALVWPLGRPERLMGADKTLRDLRRDDHLTMFSTDALLWRPWLGTRAQVSVLVAEPEAIHGQHMTWLRRGYRRFFRVYTANPALLRDIPNGVLLAYGTTWVGHWQSLGEAKKSRACSLIASSKRALEGHRLRHEVADYAQAEGLEVDALGGGYKPFGQKADGLAPYRFSVVIENVREENYFTEKLIDALLCRTVPIYWGCPNIDAYFDTSGMIVCESAAELRAALSDLSQARYAALRPALERAVPHAAHYADLFGRLGAVMAAEAGDAAHLRI